VVLQGVLLGLAKLPRLLLLRRGLQGVLTLGLLLGLLLFVQLLGLLLLVQLLELLPLGLLGLGLLLFTCAAA
jgi:hypothetical protein